MITGQEDNSSETARQQFEAMENQDGESPVNEQSADKSGDIVSEATATLGEPTEQPEITELEELPVKEEPEKSEQTPGQEIAAEPSSADGRSETAAANVKEAWNSFEPVLWPKTSILGKTRQAEQSVKEWIGTYGTKFEQFEFAFNFVAGQNRIHLVYDEEEIPNDVWFIGDIHGDILALEAALSVIDSKTPQATIVFLGDLFDRFEYGIEVVTRVVSLIIDRPGRILWIAGNHDDGLFFENGAFGSKVMPSEFCQFLNQHKEYEELGIWLIELCKWLPRALFLPDGLFVAHGGCPSFDMNTFAHSIDEVNQLQDLENDKYLHSFIWNRLIPGQDDKSEPEVGKNDLIHFMERMEVLSGIPVKRMLRGHDHCKETRHEFFDSYYPQAPVLTLTTMSAWYLGTEDSAPELDRTMRKKSATTPAIAQFRRGDLPKVLTIDIPLSVVQQFHKVEELPNQQII